MIKAIILSFFVAQCISGSGFTVAKRYVNDSLSRDTIYESGSSYGNTQAVVNIHAVVAPPVRASLNILFACDFSSQMNKSMMGDVVENFMAVHKKHDDSIVVMPFVYGREFLRYEQLADYFTNTDLTDALSDGGTALYYNLWKAVNYALENNDKSNAPAIVLVTSGSDFDSPKAFRATNQLELPRHFRDIPSDTSIGFLRNSFLSFMQDSIGDRITLISIILDSSDTSQEQAILESISKRVAYDSEEADSLFSSIAEYLKCSIVRPVAGEPMFMDMLSRDWGGMFIKGSLTASPKNQVLPDSIVVDSTEEDYYIKFYMSNLDPLAVFSYQYKIEVRSNCNFSSITPVPLNPDSRFSRVLYMNCDNETVTKIFDPDTIYVAIYEETLKESNSESDYKKLEIVGALPNPFNPTVTLKYNVPVAGNLSLSLFSLSGELLGVINERFVQPGVHSSTLNMGNLSAGSYICRIKQGNSESLKVITLLK